MYGDLGALVSFPSDPTSPTTVLARVGVSLISAEQACKNAEEEIPDFDFERTEKKAKEEWNELLGRFHVQVEDRDTGVLFYSSVSSFILEMLLELKTYYSLALQVPYCPSRL